MGGWCDCLNNGRTNRVLPRTPRPGSPVAATCDGGAVNKHGRSVANGGGNKVTHRRASHHQSPTLRTQGQLVNFLSGTYMCSQIF